MREILDLDYRQCSNSNSPSEKVKEYGRKVVLIPDLKEKLEYYNKFIYSLSFPINNSGLHRYGDYDFLYGIGEIFLKIQSAPEGQRELEIYLEVRAAEIARLKALIDQQPKYISKLKSLLDQRAGQFRPDELKIWSNEYERFWMAGLGVTPSHLLGNNDIINLEPRSNEETEAYNICLKEYVWKWIKNPDLFHKTRRTEYNGFLYESARKQIQNQIQNSIHPEETLKLELSRIKSRFLVGQIDYVNKLYSSYDVTAYEWQICLFNAFYNGAKYNYSKRKLTLDQIAQIVHIEQIIEYYKFVSNPNRQTPKDLASIFNGEKEFQLCKDLLEDLEITLNNVYLLGELGGKLFGAIVAIKETPGILKLSLSENRLLQYYNAYLKTTFKRIVKDTDSYAIGYDDAKRFLKNHKLS